MHNVEVCFNRAFTPAEVLHAAGWVPVRTFQTFTTEATAYTHRLFAADPDAEAAPCIELRAGCCCATLRRHRRAPGEPIEGAFLLFAALRGLPYQEAIAAAAKLPKVAHLAGKEAAA